MRTMAEIKGYCRIDDDGCWIWGGAKSDGWPRIYAPDYSNRDGAACIQPGRKAVWHVRHKKPVPAGYRVYSTCQVLDCVNPNHAVCMTPAEWGKRTADSGNWKGNLRRIAVNRQTARRLSVITPELIALVTNSDKKGVELAKEHGVSKSVISKIRTGNAKAFQPVGGLFTGLLMAANDSKRRAA